MLPYLRQIQCFFFVLNNRHAILHVCSKMHGVLESDSWEDKCEGAVLTRFTAGQALTHDSEKPRGSEGCLEKERGEKMVSCLCRWMECECTIARHTHRLPLKPQVTSFDFALMG